MSREEWLPLAMPAAIAFLGVCVFGTGFLVSVPLEGMRIQLKTVATDGLKIDPEPLTVNSSGFGHSVRLSGSVVTGGL